MKNKLNRVIMIVMDSAGIGELPDASLYNDEGSNTLGNLSKAVKGLNLPNLQKLGLGNIGPIEGVYPVETPLGAYGKMAEQSAGKDTTTGHWELAGILLDKPFPTYPNGFPENLIKEFETKIGRKTLGNVVASGTAIIEELGEEHVKTGYPIIYTSADSVFQIAAHEEVIPIEELYQICKVAREILVGEHAVGRVIARPFVGKKDNFTRTANRHDFSLKPIGPTVLDVLNDNNIPVIAIGKINDIYAGQGITEYTYSESNNDGINKTISYMNKVDKGFIMTNLVDFDMKYGHRNDPKGYAQALEEFDTRLGEILDKLTEQDLLILTADHGCDPTTESTDHSREYVPVLVYSPSLKNNINLGVRDTFSDVAATIADTFNLQINRGTSFLTQLQ